MMMMNVRSSTSSPLSVWESLVRKAVEGSDYSSSTGRVVLAGVVSVVTAAYLYTRLGSNTKQGW